MFVLSSFARGGPLNEVVRRRFAVIREKSEVGYSSMPIRQLNRTNVPPKAHETPIERIYREVNGREMRNPLGEFCSASPDQNPGQHKT
jgi:hypothetical protein